MNHPCTHTCFRVLRVGKGRVPKSNIFTRISRYHDKALVISLVLPDSCWSTKPKNSVDLKVCLGQGLQNERPRGKNIWKCFHILYDLQSASYASDEAAWSPINFSEASSSTFAHCALNFCLRLGYCFCQYYRCKNTSEDSSAKHFFFITFMCTEKKSQNNKGELGLGPGFSVEANLACLFCREMELLVYSPLLAFSIYTTVLLFNNCATKRIKSFKSGRYRGEVSIFEIISKCLE